VAAKAAKELRQSYIDEVRGLASVEAAMRATGASSEEIARALSAQRRALGVKYKDLSPPEFLLKVYKRNIQNYGDPLGPTIEYLRTKKGKTWEQIIESAKTPGGKDLGL
jgi:hypothetical protein